MEESEQSNANMLLAKAHISEQSFHSEVPLFGPFIVRMRTLWNSVATKWYVLPLLQQQNAFNLTVAQRMDIVETFVFEQSTVQDRDLIRLQRETAELQWVVSQFKERLQALDEYLGRMELEAAAGKSGTGQE